MRRFSGNFVSLVIALAVSFGCAAKDVENDKVALTDLHLESLPSGIYAIQVLVGISPIKSLQQILLNSIYYRMI